MRIISGKFKGRRFHPPADKWPTRPTTDFAKEGLFNILHFELDWEDTRMLDLFGGTGSHTYEAVSRGCKDVGYVDKHGPAVRFVKETIKTLDIEQEVKVFQTDVFLYIDTCRESYDYIFAGPPYGLEILDAIPDRIFSSNLLKEGGLFVLEHNPNHQFDKHPKFNQIRKYGTTHFSFFRHNS
jgi:16S rRNA (guanine966-N2)-methyltransferase